MAQENQQSDKEWPAWRVRLHDIIFEADTPMGRAFDVVLLVLIVVSIVVVMLESVDSFDAKYHKQIAQVEWFVTIAFTLEYIARLISVKQPLKYATSFYGLVDLFSTLPTYLSVIFPGSHSFMLIRALRLLRVFRILKLTRFSNASKTISTAVSASKYKIMVFMIFVVTLITIIGAIMYVIESPSNSGFESIPKSIYWAIVTLTTVGFGDITPQTALGQFLASIIMILGYGIIAVPTGIVSSEMALQNKNKEVEAYDNTNIACISCGSEGHSSTAKFCYRCGHELNPD